MARNDDLNLNRTGAAPGATKTGGKKGRGLLWVVLAVVLLAAGGAGAWFLLAGGGGEEAAQAGAAEPAAPAEAREALYLDLGRFLVNFDHKGGIRYVQTEMQLMAYSQAAIDRAERNRPAVRNEVIMLLSAQDFDTLRTVEGKEQLRADALAAVNRSLGASGPDAIAEVYFTAFVLQ